MYTGTLIMWSTDQMIGQEIQVWEVVEENMKLSAHVFCFFYNWVALVAFNVCFFINVFLCMNLYIV